MNTEEGYPTRGHGSSTGRDWKGSGGWRRLVVAANIPNEGWTAVSAVPPLAGGVVVSPQRLEGMLTGMRGTWGRSWWGKGLLLTSISLEGWAPTAFAAPPSIGDCDETVTGEGCTPGVQGVSAPHKNAEGCPGMTAVVNRIHDSTVEGGTYHWQVAA